MDATRLRQAQPKVSFWANMIVLAMAGVTESMPLLGVVLRVGFPLVRMFGDSARSTLKSTALHRASLLGRGKPPLVEPRASSTHQHSLHRPLNHLHSHGFRVSGAISEFPTTIEPRLLGNLREQPGQAVNS